MFFGLGKSRALRSADETLPGRNTPMRVTNRHAVHGQPIQAPFLPQYQTMVFALGCFWGAERKFWQTHGVITTAVGYAGGNTPNPTYEEVCSGATNHTEVVLVLYDPLQISDDTLLALFWESHDPTQGMRQGNDVGTQYRSAIYFTNDTQREAVERTQRAYQAALNEKGFPQITTEIAPLATFFYAEDYHQQYLHKNPGGYCGIGGTGVRCVV